MEEVRKNARRPAVLRASLGLPMRWQGGTEQADLHARLPG